ncbi:fibronectin type III domain-containing protein [Occallatibacter savannae]|uniref:fibronectin type III domain-containing protein n=1 Tax=Occallatibacter savannae TaxID=1002691 RepID=UPI0013A5B649|nr:fibronectin type III domain-containing protein [Occallatibacter savannae]
MDLLARTGRAAMAVGLLLCLPGCGTPGAPQPPSLNLPDPVGDLAATRAGDQVTLTWTMPKRNTDRTTIKGEVAVRICRRENDAGACEAAGPDQMTEAGAAGVYTDTLPAELRASTARPVSYFVELRNRNGRSAGLSNAATILAGAAPAPIDGLKAEVRKQGVVLSWTPDGENTAVRLERKLLTPAQKAEQRGPLAPTPEAEQQDLIVEPGAEQGHAIDKTVRFDEQYAYRAQRVARVDVGGKTLELDGAFSPAVQVEVKDVFPPSVPGGLVAVSTAGENGATPAIDLSWQPVTDSDVAGYVVYRREEGGGWQRVSAAAPIVEPAFHDAQVKAGSTYQYAVSAVDKGGHESAKSAEARETVPQP